MVNGFINTLDKIQGLIIDGKMGFIGEHLVDLSYAQSLTSKSGSLQMSHEEALDSLMGREFQIFFARHVVCYDERILFEDESVGRPYNYTLDIKVDGVNIEQQQHNFHWNGSPDELNIELKRDVEMLRNMGFSINYKSYCPEHNSMG